MNSSGRSSGARVSHVAILALGMAALLLWSGVAICSEEVAVPERPLSLEECESLALERNLAALQAEVGLKSASAAVREAKATLLPQLALTGSYTRLGPKISFEIPTQQGSQTVTVGPTLNRNATLSLTQLLYAVGPMKVARRAARVGLDSSAAVLANTRDEVLLAVRQAFFDCLRAQALLGVAKETEAQAQAHLKNAEAFYGAGTVAHVDVLRAQVEVANAAHLAVGAQNGVDLAFVALRNLLNLGQDVPLELNVPEVPRLVEANLVHCLEVAKVKRADLVGARLGIELAGAKELLAASEAKPTVSLVGDRQWKTGAAFSPTTSWSLSLVASMPILDGGATGAKVERARRDKEQGQLGLEALEQAVEAQVRGAFLSLQSSRKQIEAAEAAVSQAQEALRVTELQYSEGVARSVEVLDAEVALSQASTNRVNAVYDYEIAKAELARAAGVFSVEELIAEGENSPGAPAEAVPSGAEG